MDQCGIGKVVFSITLSLTYYPAQNSKQTQAVLSASSQHD